MPASAIYTSTTSFLPTHRLRIVSRPSPASTAPSSAPAAPLATPNDACKRYIHVDNVVSAHTPPPHRLQAVSSKHSTLVSTSSTPSNPHRRLQALYTRRQRRFCPHPASASSPGRLQQAQHPRLHQQHP